MRCQTVKVEPLMEVNGILLKAGKQEIGGTQCDKIRSSSVRGEDLEIAPHT